MPKKAQKAVRKTTTGKRAATPAAANAVAIATAIASIAEKMPESWDVDRLIDNLGEIGYLNSISASIDAHVIATYGTDEDRAKVVEYLKRGFANGDVFRD